MSFAPESETRAPETLAKPEVLLRVPLGLASPLWGLFAGAAVGASAWWWMTRWARPQNLEAMFGAAEAAVETEMEQAAALVAPAVEMIEAAGAALAQAEPTGMVEALDDALDYPPVGGESAPISPMMEALEPEVVEAAAVEIIVEPEPALVEAAEPAAAPKSRKKAAAPPAAETAD